MSEELRSMAERYQAWCEKNAERGGDRRNGGSLHLNMHQNASRFQSYEPYWVSRKNSLPLVELSSVNKVSLV